MQFTVMTFNIRGSFHPRDGDNHWPKRAGLNVATIKKYDPDVIGFQEWQSGNQATYDVELTAYAYEMGPQSIREGERQHHLPIYWKKDRFEKVKSGGFYLSETPDEWSYGWEAHLVRSVCWVQLREKASGIEFVHLNTHYDHEQHHHATRANSTRLIVERLAALDASLPKIVTADFNARPDSDAYRGYIESGYQDSWTQVGKTDNPSTFHGFKGANFRFDGLRIDWVLTKDGAQKFEHTRCDVITDGEPPVYPSDHYPVIADLTLT